LGWPSRPYLCFNRSIAIRFIATGHQRGGPNFGMVRFNRSIVIRFIATNAPLATPVAATLFQSLNCDSVYCDPPPAPGADRRSDVSIAQLRFGLLRPIDWRSPMGTGTGVSIAQLRFGLLRPWDGPRGPRHCHVSIAQLRFGLLRRRPPPGAQRQLQGFNRSIAIRFVATTIGAEDMLLTFTVSIAQLRFGLLRPEQAFE